MFTDENRSRNSNVKNQSTATTNFVLVEKVQQLLHPKRKKRDPPKDKGYLIYLTMILFGLGALAPWNMFITAKEYFIEYKLKDEPHFASNFHTYVGVASQVPSLIFGWVNVFVQMHGDLRFRVLVALAVMISMFLVTVFLAIVDTSECTKMFFWITISSLVVLQCFTAVFLNSAYGMAAVLPKKYPGAIILGQELCGTLVVVVAWVTELIATPKAAALLYFIAGNIVLLACFCVCLALSRNPFYLYYNQVERNESYDDVDYTVPYWTVANQCRQQLFNLFVIFFVSLAIFPNVYSDVDAVNPNNILGKEFCRVTCFLTFNVLALIGSITASLWQFPSHDHLKYFALIRLVFIPLFLFCNYQPVGTVRTLPVLIKSDFLYWLIGVVFSWSQGHAVTLGVIYVRGGRVEKQYATEAGMFGGAIITTGILSGIIFSGYLKNLLD